MNESSVRALLVQQKTTFPSGKRDPRKKISWKTRKRHARVKNNYLKDNAC